MKIMTGRLEYKYLVPYEYLDRIRTAISRYVVIDPFAGLSEMKEYTVRSIYLDNSHCNCYGQKIAGIKSRMKFRIRGYNSGQPDSFVFPEIKRKYINFISKNRARLQYRDLPSLLAGRDIDEVLVPSGENDRADMRRFMFHYHSSRLRPSVLVVYDREAYLGKFNSYLRITFDKNLRSATFPDYDMLFDNSRLKNVLNKNFILEVKFYGSLPGWVKSIITGFSIPRLAISKYTNCLDAGDFSNNIHQLISASNLPRFSSVQKDERNTAYAG